jgi:hypothetical protein
LDGPPKLLTAAEVAASINDVFKVSKVVAAYRAGELVGTKFGRQVFFDPSDVAIWIRDHKTPRPRPGGPTARSAAYHRNKAARERMSENQT